MNNINKWLILYNYEDQIDVDEISQKMQSNKKVHDKRNQNKYIFLKMKLKLI